MTALELKALLPLLALSATSLALLVLVIIKRNRLASLAITLLGLVLALLSVANSTFASVEPLLVIDGLSQAVMALIVLVALFVSLMSYAYFSQCGDRLEEYYLLLVLASLGACVLACASQFASLFLGLELLSISLFVLIAYLPERPSGYEASLKYLIPAASSSAFLLLGLAIIYSQTGSLRLAAAVSQLNNQPNLVLLSGVLMAFVSIGFKLAVVPFHLWTPDVYQGAPAPVTSFIATGSKGAMLVVAIRLFAPIDLNVNPALLYALVGITCLSIAYGNIAALRQNNVKRVLAYSSIAHMGYMLIPLVVGSSEALQALVFYLIAYSITTLGAFGILSVLAHQGTEIEDLEDLRGLGASKPWLSVALTTTLLSLAGIPLTAGFIGKFLILAESIGATLWILTFVLIAGSLLGLVYYLRIIVAVFLEGKTTQTKPQLTTILDQPTGSLMSLCLLALVILLFLFGILPNTLDAWMQPIDSGIFS